ncbi:glycosyltransferase family 2 protein [Verrucomicrobiota bacterium]
MKISVVTPSLNQGPFIERTIRSVLDQEGEFDLEYTVMDGGSTDGTIDILRKYEDRLTWRSEKDDGQSDAVNKGWLAAKGEVLGWLNSDDTYEPGALAAVADEYSRNPFEWCFGACRVIDEKDAEIRRFITRYKTANCERYRYTRLLGRNFISQPATFVSRKAFEEMGELDLGLAFAMDYDYWLRLGKKYDPRYIPRCLSSFRWHDDSKNGTRFRAALREGYLMSKKHAGKSDWPAVVTHWLHYRALSLIYSVL